MNLSFEKKAGFGVLVVLIGCGFAIYQIGKSNLWFAPKHTYYTNIGNADGLFPGSLVTMSGLRVGEVERLRVNEDNDIEVMFTVRSTLSHKIRFDSKAKVIRSFMIGEKRIEISHGSPETSVIANFGRLQGVDSRELTDLFSGANISEIAGRVDLFIKKMDIILEALSGIKPEDIERSSQILYPTLNNINLIAEQLRTEIVDTKVLQKSVIGFEKIATPVAQRQAMIKSILNNMSRISKEIESNKRFTQSLSTALNELIITLKAVQKTWLLSEYVDEVKGGKAKKSSDDDEDDED